MPKKENELLSLTLHSKISNKQHQSSVIQYRRSGIRTYREENGIRFTNPKTKESIEIPYEQMQTFIMAAVESYCSYEKAFENQNVDIVVQINAKP